VVNLSPMVGRVLGRYRVFEQIGSGGMGVVYRAHDDRLNRDIALKVLPAGLLADEPARRRFKQEALALSQINHPNVATIYDFDTQDGIDLLAMEYVDGTPLNERLKQGQLDIAEVTRLATELTAGLTAAHSRGVIHRDLKPGNLRLASDGRLKILDFGIAKLRKTQSTVAAETETLAEGESVAGTLPYMAPEQVRGGEVDERTDIYSAGAVLYEMATGQRAFTASTSAELTTSILRDTPAPPRQVNSEVPAALDRIVMRCLAKSPAERYPSAQSLASEIERVGSPRGWMKAARKPAVVALLAIGAATGALLWRALPRGTQSTRKPIALAVLPFRMLNPTPETSYLTLGIPDSLITRLANIRTIRVRSTSAILQYQDEPDGARRAGSALASDYVLTGTIQQTSDRYRVNVQLQRSGDGSAVWGKVYDPPRSDLLDLQDAVSEQVVQALSIQLSAAERERIYRRYTSNAAAHDLYLKGRHDLAKKQSTALGYFDQALQIDPRYALAHAGKAIACALMRIGESPPDERTKWEQCALSEAREALKLDPDLAEAHEAMAAFHRWSEFDWENTLRESDRALELNPSLYNPHRYRADAFRHMGLLDLVGKEIRSASENSPDAVQDSNLLAAAAVWDGRYLEALADIGSSSAPSVYRSGFYTAHALFYSNDRGRAIAMLEELHRPTIGGRRTDAARASFLAATGRRAEAESLLKAVLEYDYPDHHAAYAIGATYAQLGNSEGAVRWLNQAAKSGFICYPWYERDTLLEPVRKDPAFQQLRARLRSTWEANKERFGSHATAP
jgi:eukaryotic-like serine/threonine-protein kinase